jgi:hypothetical protein
LCVSLAPTDAHSNQEIAMAQPEIGDVVKKVDALKKQVDDFWSTFVDWNRADGKQEEQQEEKFDKKLDDLEFELMKEIEKLKKDVGQLKKK